jgi:hypothetical protein
MTVVDPWAGRPRPVGVWGEVESSQGRYGRSRLRVRVLPPDLTPAQWELLRAARLWSGLGLAAGAFIALAVQTVLAPWLAVTAGLAVWLAPLLIARRRTRAVTDAAREIWACHDESGFDRRCASLYDALRAEVDALCAAEERRRMDPAAEGEIQAGWQRLYDLADSTASVAAHPR